MSYHRPTNALIIPLSQSCLEMNAQKVEQKEGGGSPSDMLLNDRPLLACVALVGFGNSLWHPTAIPTLAGRFPERVAQLPGGPPQRLRPGRRRSPRRPPTPRSPPGPRSRR